MRNHERLSLGDELASAHEWKIMSAEICSVSKTRSKSAGSVFKDQHILLCPYYQEMQKSAIASVNLQKRASGQ